MKLFLFRHGIAEESDERKWSDSMRPLTEKGREKTRQMGKVLSTMLGEQALLLYSPLLRARQTAELLREVMQFADSMECLELIPQAQPQAFARRINTAKRASSIVAVGHEPNLSVLASWLLAGQMQSFIDLKKSGLICLDIEDFSELGAKTAMLQWILSPKII